MKVLLVTGSFPPMRCGVGDYTAGLARALSDRGAEVSVLTGTQAGPEDGIRVLPVMRHWRFRDLFAAVRAIRECAPDVVHIQYPTQGYDGKLPVFLPLIARLMGRRVVQTWHEIYKQQRLFLLQALVPSEVVVVRPQYREALSGLYAWAARRKSLAFIPNISSIPRTRLTSDELGALRRTCLKGQSRLIVFFGFLLPSKGAEIVFDIANPDSDHIVFAGPSGDAAYQEKLESLAQTPAWNGKVTFAGFLEKEDAAALLGAADAVVLPFRLGGGEWNTSIHAAVQQGSFVLTTSHTLRGYDPETNMYFAAVDDVPAMKEGLDRHAGLRISRDASQADEWETVAERHLGVYTRGVK